MSPVCLLFWGLLRVGNVKLVYCYSIATLSYSVERHVQDTSPGGASWQHTATLVISRLIKNVIVHSYQLTCNDHFTVLTATRSFVSDR